MFKKQHKWSDSLSILKEHEFIYPFIFILTWPRKLLSGVVCPVSGSNNRRFVAKKSTQSVKKYQTTLPTMQHNHSRITQALEWDFKIAFSHP